MGYILNLSEMFRAPYCCDLFCFESARRSFPAPEKRSFPAFGKASAIDTLSPRTLQASLAKGGDKSCFHGAIDPRRSPTGDDDDDDSQLPTHARINPVARKGQPHSGDAAALVKPTSTKMPTVCSMPSSTLVYRIFSTATKIPSRQSISPKTKTTAEPSGIFFTTLHPPEPERSKNASDACGHGGEFGGARRARNGQRVSAGRRPSVPMPSLGYGVCRVVGMALEWLLKRFLLHSVLASSKIFKDPLSMKEPCPPL